VGLDAGIEEPDIEGVVADRAILTNEPIEPLAVDRSVAAIIVFFGEAGLFGRQ
jgi:hypothetical protein